MQPKPPGGETATAAAAVPDAEHKADLPAPPARLSTPAAWIVWSYLVLLAATSLLGVFALWPTIELGQQRALQAAHSATTPGTSGSAAAAQAAGQLNLGFLHISLTPDVGILMMAALAGVLGALVHTLTRLARASGGSKTGKGPQPREALWFVTNPLQGGLLALLVVGAVEAGLLTGSGVATAGAISLFSVFTLGGLTGLFSKRMTARLSAAIAAKPAAAPASTTNP